MSELVEKLLQPISAEQPCGPDLSNDPAFDELQTILKGKPDVEMGAVKKPAEPPDWLLLQKKSVEFLGKSKHLRVTVMLCCCLLKTEGFAGFAAGLQLLRGLLEGFWPTLHPTLDPEDNHDPTQRLNTLLSITSPRGGTRWLTIVDYLYAAPICRPKGAPPLTFDDLIAAKKKLSGGEGVSVEALDLTKISAIFAEAGGERIAAHHQALQQTLEAVQGIDQFLAGTLGVGNSISFETLEGALKEIRTGLEPYLPGGGTTSTVDESQAQETTPTTAGGVSISGSIRRREDVVRAIDRICEFYQQVEPSSPVPYLLRRAQKMVMMNFVQAVQELNIATVDSLKPSMGSAVDSGSPPA